LKLGAYFFLQAISKIHLMPNYGVARLFKMLTYSHVCCAFSSARALFLNVICIFEMACSNLNVKYPPHFLLPTSLKNLLFHSPQYLHGLLP